MGMHFGILAARCSFASLQATLATFGLVPADELAPEHDLPQADPSGGEHLGRSYVVDPTMELTTHGDALVKLSALLGTLVVGCGAEAASGKAWLFAAENGRLLRAHWECTSEATQPYDEGSWGGKIAFADPDGEGLFDTLRDAGFDYDGFFETAPKRRLAAADELPLPNGRLHERIEAHRATHRIAAAAPVAAPPQLLLYEPPLDPDLGVDGGIAGDLGPAGAAGGGERSGLIGPSGAAGAGGAERSGLIGAAGGAERSGLIGPSGAAGGAERSGVTAKWTPASSAPPAPKVTVKWTPGDGLAASVEGSAPPATGSAAPSGTVWTPAAASVRPPPSGSGRPAPSTSARSAAAVRPPLTGNGRPAPTEFEISAAPRSWTATALLALLLFPFATGVLGGILAEALPRALAFAVAALLAAAACAWLGYRQRRQPGGVLRLTPGRLLFTAHAAGPIEAAPSDLRDVSLRMDHVILRRRSGGRIVLGPDRLTVPAATVMQALQAWMRRGGEGTPFRAASEAAQADYDRRQRLIFWVRILAFGCGIAVAILKGLARH